MKLFQLAIVLTLLVLCFEAEKAFPQSTPPAEGKAHWVIISWTLPTGKYNSLNIYRVDSCGNISYLKSLGKLVTHFQDNKVIGGQVLKYKLRSVMNGMESVDSNITVATIPY